MLFIYMYILYIQYSNQAVPIETIIYYNAIKEITNNIELIRQVLYESKVCMLIIIVYTILYTILYYILYILTYTLYCKILVLIFIIIFINLTHSLSYIFGFRHLIFRVPAILTINYTVYIVYTVF